MEHPGTIHEVEVRQGGQGLGQLAKECHRRVNATARGLMRRFVDRQQHDVVKEDRGGRIQWRAVGLPLRGEPIQF